MKTQKRPILSHSLKILPLLKMSTLMETKGVESITAGMVSAVSTQEMKLLVL